MAFLPMSKREMDCRGWDAVDFAYVCGDAYVDHPSFGCAIIARLLEANGYRVGIIAQPDWRDPESVAVFGEPRLGFLVSAGNMDSMVNHYTVAKKRRRTDAYSPGGQAGLRPDRACIVYGNLIRRTFKKTPIILGGIEASLRRLAHYDYWSDSLRRSILLDSSADLVSYGMGEKSIVAIADALAAGLSVHDLTYIPGTVWRGRSLHAAYEPLMLPTFEEMQADKLAYARSFNMQYRNLNPFTGRTLVEKYPHGVYVVQNPPAEPLTTEEFDAVYALPYERTWHPRYDAGFADDSSGGCSNGGSDSSDNAGETNGGAGNASDKGDNAGHRSGGRGGNGHRNSNGGRGGKKRRTDKLRTGERVASKSAGGIPALAEVKFSLTSNRGCMGDCSFCALNFHQGRIIQARSHESLLEEARAMTRDPDFKGYIHDVGGPTANFRVPACSAQLKRGACPSKRCLSPKPCSQLRATHEDYLSLLRELRALPGVKKVFVRSGIRFDYLLLDRRWGREFIRELAEHHVSGQLRVAPEHISDAVLRVMGKPPRHVYDTFVQAFEEATHVAGKEQYLVPYLMSSHPGSTLKEAIELAEYCRDLGHNPEQVQDFYPTPSTISTCIYYTGVDPRTMTPVYVPKSPHEKAMQRALIQYRNPKNRALVREALRKAGREDLIGRGPRCLVR